MAVKVIDASAVIAIVFDEPAGERIAIQLKGAELIAPTLLDFELVNACATKLRRYPDVRSDILRAFALRREMTIEIRDVDHDGVLALAEQTRLTGYDASYLWLARRLGAELVTLDGPLAQAAAAPQ